jgi:hypothetical protein
MTLYADMGFLCGDTRGYPSKLSRIDIVQDVYEADAPETTAIIVRLDGVQYRQEDLGALNFQIIKETIPTVVFASYNIQVAIVKRVEEQSWFCPAESVVEV